jgi:hypothetical protein
MTIGKALQKGTLVYIYDENGRQITSISAVGHAPEDGLESYTPLNVNIRKGSLIYSYNEKGQIVNRVPACKQNYPAAA